MDGKDRMLVEISIASSLGLQDKLSEAIKKALKQGIEATMINEVILQSFLFSGFPRAINALHTMKETLIELDPNYRGEFCFIEHENDVMEGYAERGRKLFEFIYQDNANLVIEKIASTHPQFIEWILTDAYGKVFSRPFCPLILKELCVIAQIIVLNLPRQLSSHLKGALRAGAVPDDIEQVLSICKPYIGESEFELFHEMVDKLVIP